LAKEKKMKKLLRITLVSVFIVLLGSLALAQEHWVYVTKDIAGSYYYDSNSIKHLPNKDLQVKIRYEAVKAVGAGAELLAVYRGTELIGCKIANGKKNEKTEDYALGIFVYEFMNKDGSVMYGRIAEEYYDGNNTLLCSQKIGGTRFIKLSGDTVYNQIYNAISK
jgi:hypothetical protein